MWPELIRADVVEAIREPTYEVVRSRSVLAGTHSEWPPRRLQPPLRVFTFTRRSAPVLLPRWT